MSTSSQIAAEKYPAFPTDLGGGIGDKSGMSLRDWFAGQALISLPLDGRKSLAEVTAESAYAYADAMLKERDLYHDFD